MAFGNEKLRIFISSPVKGLEKERNLLTESLEKQYNPEAMELWVSSPEHPKNLCLEKIRNSDAVILISGPYYGSINPTTGLSYTELEYDEAVAYGIDVYHFYKVQRSGDEFRSEESSDELSRKHHSFFEKIWQFRGPGFVSAIEFVSQVLTALKEHTEHRHEKLHPFVQADEYYKNFLNKGYFRHDYTLVGREKDLVILNEFVKSDKKVFVIFGRGGLGKSKLLYEFASRLNKEGYEKWKQALFLREVFNINENVLKEWPTRNCVIVLDDAHRYDDLETLLSIFKGNPNADKIKIVLSARPLGRERINYAISRNIDYESVETYEMDDLEESEVKELVSNILIKKDEQLIAIVSDMTKDCPLATIVACNLINEDFIHPKSIGHKEEFQRIIFDRFLEDFKGKEYDDLQTQRLLEYISALSPVMPSDTGFRKIMSEILKITVSDLVKRIDGLEERGLLVRKGRFVRIAPDLLSDHILYNACVSKNGTPSNFVEEITINFQNIYMENILFNISEVEWRAKASEKQINLLKGTWEKIKKEFLESPIYKRIEILDKIKKAAVFQPDHVLEIIDIAINKPSKAEIPDGNILSGLDWSNESVLEKLPALLRQIAFNIEYFEESCDLLWDLGKKETRELNQYPESALRILQELAQYGIRKPVIYNIKMLECIKKWLSQEDTYHYHYSPLDILKKLLAKEGEDTEFKKDAVVIRSFGLNYQAIDDVRCQALKILQEHVQPSKPKNIIFNALKLLTETLSYPHRLFGRQVPEEEYGYLQREQIKILGIIKNAIPILKSEALNTIIKKDLRWYQLHGRTDEIKKAVTEVVDTIQVSALFRIYRSLIENFREFLEQDYNWEKHNEQSEKETRDTALIILDKYKSAHDIFVSLNSCLKDISEYNISVNPSYVLSQIAKENPEVALKISRLIIENPDAEISRYFSSFIWPLKADDKFSKEINKIITLGIEKKDYWPCLNIAHSISYGIDKYTEHDYKNIRDLLAFNEKDISKALIHGISKIGRKEHLLAHRMGLLINLEKFPDLADEYCSIYNNTYGIPLDSLGNNKFKEILDKLMPVNIFDNRHYHIDKLFEHLTGKEEYLDMVIDFLIKRVELSRKKEDSYKYPPLPYLGFKYAFTGIARLPSYKKYVEKIRNLTVKDELVEEFFWLPKLFKAISEHYSKPSLEVLSEWMDSKDQKKLQGIAFLVREAPTQFLYDNVEFISKLLEKAKDCSKECYKNVSSYLYGMVYSDGTSRTVGHPSSRHLEMKDEAIKIVKKIKQPSAAYTFYTDILKHTENQLLQEKISDEELEK